jgi:hypothetical protein
MRPRLKKAMKAKPVLAAVAYVTDVKELPLGEGDTLVCDAMSGSTDPKAMRALLALGVQVFSRSKLHAKVVVDGKRAIVGSSNWSQNSEGTLIEASLDTDDPAAVKAAAAFVRKQVKGAETVDEAFIDRMPPLKPRAPSGKRPPKAANAPPNTWLLYGVPLVGHEKIKEVVAARIKRLSKVTGNVTMDLMRWDPGEKQGERIRVQDRIVLIWHGENEPVVVYPPAEVVQVIKTDQDLAIIYAGASNHEERTIGWKRFKTLSDRTGLPKNITPRSGRRLDSLKADELLEQWPKK